ncbi:hypothetical protein [Anaerovorax sp. IOR16]|uniref:hypothetical protein n=1 Tax=Anaerovorax sp. IOR16 TaxID=2773458 RepID=UPI0019CF7903|nr:hypothetical protein [Anaerovorax sp. IOR16]
MKITYNTQKGNRYKCSSEKLNKNYNHKYHRLPIFCGVFCRGVSYWWVEDLKKWCKSSDIPKNVDAMSDNCNITNIKQFVRHLKKCEKYLPKGTIFVLRSNFVGVKNIIGRI